MTPRSSWTLLLSLWRPQHVMPPHPADERVITDPLQIRRTLNELAGLRRVVDFQAADGGFVGRGVLAIDGVHGIVVQLLSAAGGPQAAVPWPQNATASGPHGMVLFTLRQGDVSAEGVLRATWPECLICVQSRRHFRLPVRGLRQVWLTWSGSSQRVAVRDLSEAGVGLEMSSPTWPVALPAGAAELHLGDEVIAVPAIEAVHGRTGQAGGPGAVGARLLGMGEEQVRALRRWLSAAQAGMASGGGAA